MAYKFILKDAFRQLLWRLISAFAGFYVITLITPYIGPLRYGDYSTILKYFAIWSALADFGLYVIALKDLWKIKHDQEQQKNADTTHDRHQISLYYSKFVTSRLLIALIVYSIALLIAYCIPAYISNPYILRWLPLGMIFSASFVASGISQLPFQLYRQMHHVTIGIVLARISQLWLLLLTIYVLFPVGSVDFNDYPTSSSLTAFLLIVVSVIASALVQFVYTLRQGGRILPLYRHIDRSFSWWLICKNIQYGLAYYMSSFHTLIVLILLSIYYPTVDGFVFVGMWWLALSFIEMLLIIPPSIANGVMHRTSHYSLDQKKTSYGNLLLIMILLAGCIGIYLISNAHDIISIVAWSQYLSTSDTIWSDQLLPWFAIVLLLNFVKQTLNYLFVSTNMQHTLLWVNGIGVLIGTSIGLPLIIWYGLLWWMITQVLLEVLFVMGSLIIAYQKHILPIISLWRLMYIILVIITGLCINIWIQLLFSWYYSCITLDSWLFGYCYVASFLLSSAISGGVVLLMSRSLIKILFTWLTIENDTDTIIQ